MSGLRSRRPPGSAAAARATWPRCRPTSMSPRRWRVSPCAGAQNSPCRRRRSSLTAWSVPLAPEPSLSAPSGVALVLFAEGCQSCAPPVAAGRVARSLLVPPTPGCPALRRASHHSPLPNSTGRRSAVQPGRCLFARPGWVRRRVTPDATPALPFSRPPSVRGAHLECRFRSSPPTHHGGDRTRRHDGESRPCRRTPSGLLSQGATRARGGGVNCKQSASRRGFAGGAGASLKGGPFEAVQRRNARHTRDRGPLRQRLRMSASVAALALGLAWAPPTSAHRRPKRPPWCSSRPPLAEPAAGGPVPIPDAPRRSPDGGAS